MDRPSGSGSRSSDNQRAITGHGQRFSMPAPTVSLPVITRAAPPSILRRKRAADDDRGAPTMVRTQPSYRPATSQAQRAEEAEDLAALERQAAYVDAVAAKYHNKNLNAVLSVSGAAMSSSAVSARLRHHRPTDCDLSTLTCAVQQCGRDFDSVQVLAFHMSYSHVDISIQSTSSACMCYVCGHELATAKGKVIHLQQRHRALMQRHSEQCMQQRNTVISPLAPAAKRLADLQHYMYLAQLAQPGDDDDDEVEQDQ